ncbi:putative transporter [Methanolobus tindarius DSM 2278]|uniref:Putative transporter n=1 Tax=Methanolobus tindarius DSM 2278 TaxID=1090322 RepID=W9DP47_METTI|nr:DUF2162 domain-containing protein [Methanolobus tindarius]ETA66903.1 putative transporter [Methanolobus tindarius DSM 2278]
MDIAYSIVVGILLSILVFGMKTGAGCGFSSIGFKKILLLGGTYFIISLIMGSLTGYINIQGLQDIAGKGMVVHSILAILLIGVGIYTNKKWNCGCDVSKHTFVLLSLPCPVCLAALFLSCMILVTTFEVNGMLVGLLVGLVFFISVVSSAYLFRKMGKKPDTLGNIMVFLGLFYMLSILLIPSFIKMQSMNITPVSSESVGIIPFLVFGIFILAGYLKEKIRRHS